MKTRCFVDYNNPPEDFIAISAPELPVGDNGSVEDNPAGFPSVLPADQRAVFGELEDMTTWLSPATGVLSQSSVFGNGRYVAAPPRYVTETQNAPGFEVELLLSLMGRTWIEMTIPVRRSQVYVSDTYHRGYSNSRKLIDPAAIMFFRGRFFAFFQLWEQRPYNATLSDFYRIGIALTSVNGIDWEVFECPEWVTSGWPIRLAAGPDRAVTSSGYYSDDGFTWRLGKTQWTAPTTPYASQEVVYGGGMFLHSSGSYSFDGRTWYQRHSSAASLFGADSTTIRIAYGNGRFIAGSQFTRYGLSVDGVVWETFTGPTTGEMVQNRIARATGGSLSNWEEQAAEYWLSNPMYVDDAQGGFIIGFTNYRTLQMTRDFGETWETITLPNITWRQEIYRGSLGFVILAQNTINSNAILTSPDGITWTQRTLPVSRYWDSVGFTLDYIVVSGQNINITGNSVSTSVQSSVYRTNDFGVTWEESVMPGPGAWAIAATDDVNTIVAINMRAPTDTQKQAVSYDRALTWTVVTMPAIVSPTISNTTGTLRPVRRPVLYNPQLDLFAVRYNTAVQTSVNGTDWGGVNPNLNGTLVSFDAGFAIVGTESYKEYRGSWSTERELPYIHASLYTRNEQGNTPFVYDGNWYVTSQSTKRVYSQQAIAGVMPSSLQWGAFVGDGQTTVSFSAQRDIDKGIKRFAFAGGKFIATFAEDNNAGYYSLDGVDWERFRFPTGALWDSVASSVEAV